MATLTNAPALTDRAVRFMHDDADRADHSPASDVRPEVIQRAKRRIDFGFYDAGFVLDRVVDEVVRDLGH
jgi:hypothetical protein